MLTIDKINELIGVDESFHASYKLAEIMNNENKREILFKSFLETESDLTYDWFKDYYQTEHSDRKGKMQDFTPDGIIKVASGLLGSTDSNADICAGTGGLSISMIAKNPDAEFYCEEFSDRAIPFLLFNLAIRNINGTVWHGDSLTCKVKQTYKLAKGKKFSAITKVDNVEDKKSKTVIMNPPYSLRWGAEPGFLKQERFAKFEKLAPKSKADFAFLLHGFNQLRDGGIMSVILPHGVLFRSGAEYTIRRKLLEFNAIEAVIGLPGKAFMNTDIPTVILILKKNRRESDVFVVAAEEEYTKQGAYNILEDKHVEKILSCYKNRWEVDKFSKVVSFEEIKEQDFNLNIPRYVDKFEPEPVKSLAEIQKDLMEIDKEIAIHYEKLGQMMGNLTSSTPEAEAELETFVKFFQGRALEIKQRGQLGFNDLF